MRLSVFLAILYLPGALLAQVGLENVDTVDYLHTVSKSYRTSFRCYPRWQESTIGISYSTKYKLAGVKAHEFTTWKFGIPVMLMTDVDWRMSQAGSTYFNLELARHRVARIDRFYLGMATGYKRVSFDNSNIVEQFYSGPSHFGSTYIASFYFCYQKHQINGEGPDRQQGIGLQLYKEVGSLFDVTACAKYWFNSWQYSLKIKDNLFESDFYIAGGFEKTGKWQEFDVSVLYRYW